MSIQYRRRMPLGSRTHLNVSKRGASVSRRAGRVTVNSRGSVRVRLAPGLSWRVKL